MGEEEHDIILQKVQEAKVRHFVHESLSIQVYPSDVLWDWKLTSVFYT